VQVRCDNCEATYDIDPPAGAVAVLTEMMFRCTGCGRTFPIRFGEPEIAAAPAPQASAESASPQGILLKQEGKVYHVEDLAKLQRWIAERRVLAIDQISQGGSDWQAVGQVKELQVFFSLLDQADNEEGLEPGEISGSFDQTEIIIETDDVVLPAGALEITLPDQIPVPEIALEGIPDESELPPPAPSFLGPDDPTMDLGGEAEDFFSEETRGHPATDAALFDASTEEFRPDDDPDFVWAAHKKRQQVIWWIVLFVIGTGLGVVFFDFLNQQDQEKSSNLLTLKKQEADQNPSGLGLPNAGALKAKAKTKAKAKALAKALPGDLRPEALPVPPEAADLPPPEVIQPPIEKAKEEKKEDKDDRKSASKEIRRGWDAMDKGDPSKARTHFKSAADAGGGTEARFGLARAMEEQGDKAGAARLYCKVAKSGRGEPQTVSLSRLKSLKHTCP